VSLCRSRLAHQPCEHWARPRAPHARHARRLQAQRGAVAARASAGEPGRGRPLAEVQWLCRCVSLPLSALGAQAHHLTAARQHCAALAGRRGVGARPVV